MNLDLYDNIPPELKVCPNWVCGRAADKSSVNPNTGGNAIANVPGTWGTLGESLKIL
jgi:primase-polymerase (primpol)-like protein